MDEKNRKIILAVVLILIIGGIFFFNKYRAINPGGTNIVELKVDDKSARINEKAINYPRAKELVGIAGYINADEFKLEDYLGKNVILLDFWTYSCINCQRTLPYLTSWWEKYEDEGLIIIGVHTPEFGFEKVYDNVIQATKKFNVNYPVVQDNNYETWQAYSNRYWPTKYLIDIDGFIVYDHIGEGGYLETEEKIQELLNERNLILNLNKKLDVSLNNLINQDTDYSKIKTREVYFGILFSRKQFGNPEGWRVDADTDYSYPSKLEPGLFYLDGVWKSNPDNMELISQDGGIKIKYDAKNANLVAGANVENEVTILVDGVEIKKVIISDFNLYNVVEGKSYGEHELEIKANKSGLMAYTFTFG